MSYRCTICGYVYEGENLPGNFVCPKCKQPADKFEKIEAPATENKYAGTKTEPHGCFRRRIPGQK